VTFNSMPLVDTLRSLELSQSRYGAVMDRWRRGPTGIIRSTGLVQNVRPLELKERLETELLLPDPDLSAVPMIGGPKQLPLQG
jgi:hypothetical protein